MSLNRRAATDLSLVADVMAAWSEHKERTPKHPPTPVQRVLDQYRPPVATEVKRRLKQLARAKESSDPTEHFEYFVLTPVRVYEPELYPVARLEVSVKSGEVCVSLRLVVYSEDDGGSVRARGWRYESADIGTTRGDRFHHFPHVQSISSWTRADPGIHPPGDPHQPLLCDRGVHESRPAFPLRTSRPFGVLIAAMGSLYGATQTLVMLEATPGVDVSGEAAQVLCN